MDNDSTGGGDPLQSKDDYFNPDIDEIKLSEDNDPPFRPANDVPDEPQVPADHPMTDDGVEPEDAYENGTAEASGYSGQQVGSDTQAKPVELNHEDPEK